MPLSERSANLVQFPPPQNQEAETALLGALLFGRNAIDRVSATLRPEHFADELNARIYDAILRLTGAGSVANPVTLSNIFPDQKTYLAQLAGSAVLASNIAHYAKIIIDLWHRRELMLFHYEGYHSAAQPEIEVGGKELLEAAEHGLFRIAAEAGDSGTIRTAGAAARIAIEQAEIAFRSGGKLSGLPTGIYDLDQLTGGLQRKNLIVMAARPSMGKAQPLDSKVLTPSGWKPMGNLRLGDEVASVDGTTSRVDGMFPQGERQVYRISFSDGRSTEACAEHLWRAHNRKWREPKTLRTDEIATLIQKPGYVGRIWFEPFSGEFGSSEGLPVDPWLLGVLIGDGHVKGSQIRFSSVSEDLIARVGLHIGAGLVIQPASGCDYRIVRRSSEVCLCCGSQMPAGRAGRKYCSPKCVDMQKNRDRRADPVAHAAREKRPGSQPNPLAAALKSLGLHGVGAPDKFVPDSYKNGPRATRVAVLMGLLDTDGSIEKHGTVRFYTTSRRLACDAADLARSIGAWATIRDKQTSFTHLGIKKPGLPSLVVNIAHHTPSELFSVPEKKIRAGRVGVRSRRPTFTSIVPSRIAATQCISVTHPQHLYITDDYVVTHNTALIGSIITNISRHLNRETTSGERTPQILFFSQEMSSEQLAQRDIARFTGVPTERLASGKIEDHEWMLLNKAQEMLDSLPVIVDESGRVSTAYVRQVARRVKRQKGLALIVIDHLQKMRQGAAENRRLEIGDITGVLAALSKELDVPVVLLSQLSRALELRDDKRPILSDLRESGDIEQDADVVIFIHRDEYYLERSEPAQLANESPEKFSDRHEKWHARMAASHNIAELLVPKVRQGRTGKVTAFFDGARYLFDNYQRGPGER